MAMANAEGCAADLQVSNDVSRQNFSDDYPSDPFPTPRCSPPACFEMLAKKQKIRTQPDSVYRMSWDAFMLLLVIYYGTHMHARRHAHMHARIEHRQHDRHSDSNRNRLRHRPR